MSEPNPDNPTAEFALTFDEGEVKVTLEFHFSDNAEDFIDPAEFVNVAAGVLFSNMLSG